MGSSINNKTEQAYERIKQLIINGEFESNQMLSENRLCSMLDMSRTPIRNALKMLEAQDFITIAPKQGIIIREVSAKRHAEIWELRKILEEYVVRKMVPVFTSSDIEFLKKCLTDQEEALSKGDAHAFLESDMKMHMFLFESYDNVLIKNVMTNVREMVYLAAQKALSKPGRMDTTLQEHRTLIDAIERKDTKEVIKALKYHLKMGHSLLL